MSNTSLRRDQLMTLVSMYAGYTCFMILRTAPGVASAAIQEDPSMEIDLTAWGRITSLGTTGGIIGKFICGYAADHLGGKRTFALGLFATSSCVAAFSCGVTEAIFGLTFFGALLAKSAGWPAMAKLIVNWYQPARYGRVWGIIATSSRVGTILAMLALGALLQWMSWRWMLLVASGIGILATTFIFRTLVDHPVEPLPLEDDGRETSGVSDDHPLAGITLPAALRVFFCSSRFWLITFSLMGLTILWDFLFFLPSFLKDTLELDASKAAMVTSAFPAGSLISVLTGGFLFDKMSRRRMSWIMGLLLLFAASCIGTLTVMPNLHLTPALSKVMAAVLLFFFGVCVSPCYYIPMSVFSMDFGGPHSGFLISLLDAIAFGGSAVFSFFGGELAETYGWDTFMGLLVFVAIWSTVTMFFFLRTEAGIIDQRVEQRSHENQ
ncbi:MAG: MFS transporter [Phycisphaerales bacterium]|nr:MFS transporter [Phycisphaerales bacterium]